MTDTWEKVYSENTSFFGDDPSHFARIFYDKFTQSSDIKIILEPDTSIMRTEFVVANNAIMDRVNIPYLPKALSIATASGASDKDNTLQPTKEMLDIATRT